MGFCRLCGRELTDPESVKIGVGPVCLEKLISKEERERKGIIQEEKENLQIPGQMEVSDFLSGG